MGTRLWSSAHVHRHESCTHSYAPSSPRYKIILTFVSLFSADRHGPPSAATRAREKREVVRERVVVLSDAKTEDIGGWKCCDQ